MKKPKITFVRTEFNASGYYRMHLPARALADKGWPVAYGDLSFEDFARADILVFQRLKAKRTLGELTRWKEAGKKIVIDFDDNFFLLDDSNPVKAYVGADVLKRQGLMCELADALTVTTEPLAHSYARFNSNIHVLPNMVDQANLARERARDGRLTIGWQGTSTHVEDLKVVRSPLNALARRHDFDFILFGCHPPGFFRKAQHRPWVNFSDELPHLDRITDFSVGLCPLVRSAFNDCKSDIKFLEYSLLGIPTVASNMITYSTIKNGETGYLARNLSEWEKCLELLIKDEEKRDELGQNAKEYCAGERTIQGNISRWEEVFSAL